MVRHPAAARSSLRHGTLAVVVTVMAALVATSCATTRATRRAPEPSGFLGDYSQLRPWKKGEAQLREQDTA